MHAFDGQTKFLSRDRVCIPYNAVKTIAFDGIRTAQLTMCSEERRKLPKWGPRRRLGRKRISLLS